jgi:hypothetical protein
VEKRQAISRITKYRPAISNLPAINAQSNPTTRKTPMEKFLHRLEIEIPTILRRATKLWKFKVLMHDDVARPDT